MKREHEQSNERYKNILRRLIEELPGGVEEVSSLVEELRKEGLASGIPRL